MPTVVRIINPAMICHVKIGAIEVVILRHMFPVKYLVLASVF